MRPQQILVHLCFLLFLLSGIEYARFFTTGVDGKRRRGLFLFVLALAAGVATLTVRYLRHGSLYPDAVLVGPFEVFLLLSVSVALLTLLGVLMARTALLPLFSAPIAVAFTIAANFFLRAPVKPREELVRPFFIVHAITGILGYAAFLMLVVVSILYLVQEKQLKKRPSGSLLERLPSLADLDRAQYLFLASGFGLHTLVIGSGIFRAIRLDKPVLQADPKVILALMTWTVYGVLFLVRTLSRLRGHRMAVLSIGASLLILATLFGELAWPGWHDFLFTHPTSAERRTGPPAPTGVEREGG